MGMFRIKNWRKLYETNESRKYKRLPWLKSPCDLQSTGLSMIREHDEAAGILGVWELLRQYAASREAPRDGSIGRIDSPLSPRAIAIAIGLPEKIVATAMPVLVSVGWVEVVEAGENREETGRTPGDDRDESGTAPGENRKKVRSTLTLTPTLRDESKTREEEEKIPPSAAVAGKPRRESTTPPHRISAILTAWDRVHFEELGTPYVRTKSAAEAAQVKRLIAATDKGGMSDADIEAAMRRFHGDPFWAGKGVIEFCSHFSEFTRDKPKDPRKAQRFTKDDPLFQGMEGFNGFGANGVESPRLLEGGVSGSDGGGNLGNPVGLARRIS